MNNDSIIIKTLTDLELRDSPTLTPEQEEMLRLALNPEEQFLTNVEKLFKKEDQ